MYPFTTLNACSTLSCLPVNRGNRGNRAKREAREQLGACAWSSLRWSKYVQQLGQRLISCVLPPMFSWLCVREIKEGGVPDHLPLQVVEELVALHCVVEEKSERILRFFHGNRYRIGVGG